MDNIHIVYDSDATRYEVNVSYVDNKKSDYDTQFVVSLVNFGECFFESDLNFIAEAILMSSKTLSSFDAKNIQNAIAESGNFAGVNKVKYDLSSKKFVMVE